MTQLIDKIQFEDLAACDPKDVTQRTQALYDEKKGCYLMRIWNSTYEVIPGHCSIKPQGKGHRTYRDYWYLFILHYLMHGKNISLSGQWVSEKDLIGGAAFFRGPHTLPTQVLAQAFGQDLSAFLTAGKRLGGKPLSMADAAFVFEITPQIPVAVLLWLGDEEFESQSKLLFDKTIDRHLALDIIYALAVEVCHAF